MLSLNAQSCVLSRPHGAITGSFLQMITNWPCVCWTYRRGQLMEECQPDLGLGMGWKPFAKKSNILRNIRKDLAWYISSEGNCCK